MLIPIHPENPETRHVATVVNKLEDGGVLIIPTDTVYALVCDIRHSRAFERLCRIRGVKPSKARFSLLLKDLAGISEYTKPFDRAVFKLLKSHLPGPYTFILPASSAVPSMFRNNRKDIGIRVPDNRITHAILNGLNAPLVSASLHDDADEIVEYLTDPEEINNRFGNLVDIVVDGGPGGNTASSVIDCTGEEPAVVR